jgi:hypothetical protein
VRAAFALLLVTIIALCGTAALLILLYNVTVMINNYFFV